MSAALKGRWRGGLLVPGLTALLAFDASAQSKPASQAQLNALEARVAALESRLGISAAPSQAAAPWKQASAWSQLKVGMPEQRVFELLGKTSLGQRDASGVTTLVYQDMPLTGLVYLVNDKVVRWATPLF
jgi:hypothetical protein